MKEKLQVWIDKDLRIKLENYCSKNDTNNSQLVRKLIREFLNNEV